MLCRGKVVAIGAVSYYVDHFVTGRIAKFTYGVFGNTKYDSSNPEHVRREHKSWDDAIGVRRIPDHFRAMLTRVRYAQPLLCTLD